MRIRDRTVVITGASSGIGRDLALRAAGRGARTVLVARRAERLEEVRRECERAAPSVAIPCDVRDRGQVEAALERARSVFGRVDVLVNNAGYSRWTLAREASVEDYEDMIRTNFLAAVYATKALLEEFLERGSGHFVNVASIAGEVGVAHHSHYCASKFALVGFTESLWYELRGSGVGVTLVKPGVIDTELFSDSSFDRFPVANRARMIPVGAVSEAILEAVERDRFEVTVPRHFALGPAVRHVLPSLFRRIVARTQT